jgi:DNA-binding transcriptional LysR family regulator
LQDHNCLTFNFRRSRIGWPFRNKGRDFEQPVAGNLQVNNGETMRQVALAGVGVARLGLFHVADAIKVGQLVPLLEKYNPGDLEMIHAIYLGGGHLPGRVRAFIDHIAETLSRSPLFK